jgi:predicted RNase H-like HicB family nuclease
MSSHSGQSAVTRVMTFKVVVRAECEDGGYSVECPALRGCRSQGETVEEALSNIRDAIREYLSAAEELAERGESYSVAVEVDE